MEYIFILGFIIALIIFWRFLYRTKGTVHPGATTQNPEELSFHRLRLPQSLYYHQGHCWVEPEWPDVARIGVDDFAQKLIGRADFIDFPQVGASLKQGEKGWKLGSDKTTMDVLSPVDGEVLEINEEVLREPQLINRDPFGNGWLMKVRVPKMKNNISHLLSGELATVWLKENTDAFVQKLSGDSKTAARRNQTPVNEIADTAPQHRWNELAREFLLCE